MDTKTHQHIRHLMRECGVWTRAINMKIYTTEEFIADFEDSMPAELTLLLRQHVSRMQAYCDERILVPIK